MSGVLRENLSGQSSEVRRSMEQNHNRHNHFMLGYSRRLDTSVQRGEVGEDEDRIMLNHVESPPPLRPSSPKPAHDATACAIAASSLVL